MADVQSKRPRRTDDSAPYDKQRSSRRDRDGESGRRPERGERSDRRDTRRSYSRSPGRDGDKDRHGSKRKAREDYDRDSRDRRDRDRDGHRDKRRMFSHDDSGLHNVSNVVTGDSRTRSRSPKRESGGSTRRRSPPRGPRTDRDRTETSRSNGTGARPPTGPRNRTEPQPKVEKEVKMENGIDEDDEEAMMERLMGFGKFRSTKNTKVPGNDKNFGVRKVKKTEYRQYMNRQGGFNRPLSPG